jgi:hypothetical protein
MALKARLEVVIVEGGLRGGIAQMMGCSNDRMIGTEILCCSPHLVIPEGNLRKTS